jgi:tetratricopeptide (TPR) repeat protein
MMSRYVAPLRDKMIYTLVTAQYTQLIDLGKQILVAARKQDDPTTESLALVALATAHRRVGKFYEAQIFAEGAIKLAEQIGNGEILVDALVEYGNVRLEGFFQANEALAEFDEALSHAHRVNYALGIRHALLGKCNAFLMLNLPQNVLLYAAEGLQSAQDSVDPVAQIGFLLVLGAVYRHMRQAHRAESCLDSAQAIVEKLDYKAYVPLIQIQRGLLINRKDTSPVFFLNEALRHARLAKDFGAQVEVYRALVHVYTYDAQPDYAVAQSYADELLDLAQAMRSKPHEASAFSVLGHLAFLQNQTEQAQMWYEQALSLTREMMNPFQEAICLQALGTLDAQRHDYEQALNAYQQALAVYRSLNHAPKEREMVGLLFMTQLQRILHRILVLLGLRR